MNRAQFFSELGKGMLKTVMEIAEPFINDDLDKIDQTVDQIAGVDWVAAGPLSSFKKEGVHEVYVKGKPIVILRTGTFQAYEKICPHCSAVPQWIAYEKRFKCFGCGSEYDIYNGNARLKECFVKIKEDRLLIGFFK